MRRFKRNDTQPTTDIADEIATVRRVMHSAGTHRVPTFGAPTRCPDCGEWGLVDGNDGAATANHCYLCGTTWSITRRALAATTAEPTPLHPELEPAGVLYETSRAQHPSNADFVPQPTRIDLAPVTPIARRTTARHLVAIDPARRVHIVGA